MKKLFALLAVVLAVASCQKESNDLAVNMGEQETLITVALPEATRANSALGGLDNNVRADHQLRYILEIYSDINTDKCLRNVKFAEGEKTEVVFNVRLVPGHAYDFVVWADFVAKGAKVDDDTNDDLYYNTESGLDEITIKDNVAMTEARDAYYNVVSIEAGEPVSKVNTITLTRPFAKVRVVADDVDEAKAALQNKLTTAKVTYSNDVVVYNTFNARTKSVSGEAAKVKEITYPSAYDESNLYVDYLLVPQDGQSNVKFDLNVDGFVNRAFKTDIAVEANKLTTIKGNILTNGSDITVDVNDDFNKPDYTYEVVYVETPEQLQEALENTEVGEIILQKDITLDGSLTFGAPATTASTFATRTNTDLPGRNITIDGNGKTLKSTVSGKNVRVIDFTSATNGANFTLKNLTIENTASWVERIVNYNTNGTLTLENVKITNAEGCKLNYAINLPAYSDNAKVVIKNCEIWANANALNLYGENTRANITNSKLYVVDDSATEGYAVVSLGNDGKNGAHNSVINVEGGEIKAIYTGEGATEPSSALRDATVGSKINISTTTDIDGEVKIPVANVIYEGYNEFYTCTTLQEAINKAAETPSTATVVLIKDITVAKDKTQSNGYGAVGAQQLYGGIIDGNDKSFRVNAWGTWDSAINTTGGTIKNLNVTGGMRGIFINHNSKYSAKVVLENVTIDGTIYTISCDQGTNNGLEATNCTFNGWTSYAATLGATKFVGCSFGEGQGYAFCRPYATTEFVNCAFEAGYELDPCATVTFENCTIDGVALTAENLSNLVIAYEGAVENASVK